MKCELLDQCIFFNDKMDDMPPNSGVYKNMYCVGNSLNCARYLVAKRLGREKVPRNMLPNNRKEAMSFLSANT